MKQRTLFILLIVAVAFTVYAPSLHNGYVWDDSALIQRDPFIRSWRLIPEGFRHYLFTNATASNFYRPLQRVTYTWDYAWSAFQPALYHFTNILIHALAAVFLFLFMERLLAAYQRPRARVWAAVIAGIWAIHPLFTSAVCYISGRADPLAAMFGFCGLWLAIGFKRTGTAVAALMFFCAVLSKESGAIFLPLCVALMLLLKQPRAAVLRWIVIILLVAGAALALRLTAEKIAPPPGPALALGTRPIIALRALAEYAGLFLAPVRLHMERDVLPFGRGGLGTTINMARNREFQTLLGAVLLAGLIFWMRWARRKDGAVFAGLVCFVIAYLPICGLFSLNASVAEHWLYVPAAFLLLAALLSVMDIPERLGVLNAQGVLIAVIAVWAFALGVRTWLRNPDWHDQRTFLEKTIADGGGDARMLINLADLELTEDHPDLAIADFQKALDLAPDQPFALIGIGSAHLREKQYSEAREEFEKARLIPITQATALQALAVLDYQENHLDRMDLLQQAAHLAPEDWDVQKRFIEHAAERGQVAAAISALRAVVETEGWRADAWKLLGDLWARVGRYDSAARAYRNAIALDVHDDETPRKLADIAQAAGNDGPNGAP